MDWNETPSPFARLCDFVAELREEQEQGNPAWSTRLAECFPLIDQITDPTEQEQIRALTADWLASIVNEETVLDAQALLVEAQAEHQREAEKDTSNE